MGVSQPTVAILLLLLLVLPTVGAFLARLAGRRFGPRASQSIAMLGFAVALGSGIALRSVDVDGNALGGLSIFVPRPGPLIDAEAWALPRHAPATPVEAPVELALLEPSPVGETATPEQPPSPSPTARPSATVASAAVTPASTIVTATPPPSPSEEPTSVPSTATARSAAATTRSERAQAYVVKSGDTLRSIAAKFDLSVDALLRYNGLSREEGDQLQLDQKLYIPPAGSSGQATNTQPTPRPPTATSRPAAKAQLYIVKSGDTLRSIAAKFDISVDALLRYNGLARDEGDKLQPDQKLYIPPS